MARAFDPMDLDFLQLDARLGASNAAAVSSSRLPPRADWRFDKIVVPLDGSDESEHALTLASELVHATGGRLVLVRTAWAGVGNHGEAQYHSVVEAESYLRQKTVQLSENSVAVDVAVPFERP